MYKSESSFFVFEKDLNYANTLFGGKLMAECDCEAAKVGRAIVYKVDADNAVTASFHMDFHAPASRGDLIKMQAEAVSFGSSSVRIAITCTKTNRDGEVRIAEGVAVFVIMKEGKPFKHNLKTD